MNTEEGPIIRVMSINVGGGLREKEKREALKGLIKENETDLLLVQETKFRPQDKAFAEKALGAEYKGFILSKERSLIEEEFKTKELSKFRKEWPQLTENELLDLVDVSQAKTNGGLAIFARSEIAHAIQVKEYDQKEGRYSCEHRYSGRIQNTPHKRIWTGRQSSQIK